MNKTMTLLAGAAGYVLGARAGRARFEQIKVQADKVWNNPQVQKAASNAADVAAEKAPIIKDRAAAAADKATDAAKSAASKSGKSKETSGGTATRAAATDEPVLPGAVSNPRGPSGV